MQPPLASFSFRAGGWITSSHRVSQPFFSGTHTHIFVLCVSRQLNCRRVSPLFIIHPTHYPRSLRSSTTIYHAKHRRRDVLSSRYCARLPARSCSCAGMSFDRLIPAAATGSIMTRRRQSISTAAARCCRGFIISSISQKVRRRYSTLIMRPWIAANLHRACITMLTPSPRRKECIM